MAFIETPRFPEGISYGATGGAEYKTDVVVVNSGYEQRNITWDAARSSYDVAHAVTSVPFMKELIKFFRSVKGRAHGFRFKDWSDYEVLATEGLLDGGVGDGTPTYQLYKKYEAGALNELREIKKPVTATIYRNTVAQTAGAGAGNYALDTTTGVVTFVADASGAASAITVGATTQISFASDLGLSAGKKIYLAGFTGADAALLNGIAHTINSIAGTAPYVFTLATNTAGKTITLGSGIGYKYPQASDALTWAGEFDVPCRFDTDKINVELSAPNIQGWTSIPIVEIRV